MASRPLNATSPRLRVLVADDEPAARDKLRRLLKKHDDVELVGAVSNGTEATQAIAALSPNVVLLDIRMPELDGFSVIARSKASAAFYTIFVTAYDEYAIRAFDVRALDYLLKPFDAARLAAALRRARDQIELTRRAETSEQGEVAAAVIAQLAPPASEADIDEASVGYLERICIRSLGRTQIVRVAAIEWIEAYGNYVRLHALGEHPLARDTLSGLVARLDPSKFCRIHRSAVVNIDKVRDMRPTTSGDYIVRLDSGVRLRLSRGYRAELLGRMSR